MKKMTILTACVAAACLVFSVACSGEKDAGDALESATQDLQEAGKDLADAVDDVVEEAGGDAASAIAGTVDELKAALAEKEDELQAVKDKLAAMSPSDLTGGDASKLKEQSETLMDEIKGLKEKLESAIN